MARNRRHSHYRPAVAQACGVVLAAALLAVLVLPFSIKLLAIAAVVAALALAVWVREQARRGGRRYRSASGTSFDNASDYPSYGNAFDGGASSAFSDAGDDTRACRFDGAFDSSSGSFDSGGSDSGSGGFSDCGGGSGGD